MIDGIKWSRTRAKLFLASIVVGITPLLGAWTPTVEWQNTPVWLTFKERDLREDRPLFISPRDIALGCTGLNHASTSYVFSDKTEGGRVTVLTCENPPDRPTAKMNFFFSNLKTKRLYLIGITGAVRTNPDRPVELDHLQVRKVIKDMRDRLIEDHLIPLELEEGRDAFGHYRVCKSNDDVNCMPRSN